MFYVGDLVQVRPVPNPIGKVIKVHEYGNFVDILWPSGAKQTIEVDHLISIVQRENLERLGIENIQ